jgi:proteasome lid subunit RPN8/RPN11
VVDEKDWQDAIAAGLGPYLRATAKLHATLPANLLQEIIDHSRAGVPNEACGLLVGPAYAGDGGVPTHFMALRNAAESPYRYMLADEDLLKVVEIEDAGEVVWGIVHSHVASAAEPSATDIGLARYPESLYLICSLANPAPDVRAWSISDYAVLEVPLGVS